MAPAVPRRDPTTALQQQQQPPQQSGNSPPCPTVPENVAVSKPMAANIDDNASTSLSSGTNQNRLTIDMSDNRKTGFSNLTGYSTNKDESTTSQIHIPPISTRHVSFPNGTTTATVADGRSVVPWNLGTRDLSQEVADLPRTSETNTNNQETVTLSTSVFSDGTPQWIPPGQKSSRHRLLSCPPSKLVEFAAQDNTNSASVSVRNQITKGGRLGLAERPTCLLDKSQTI
ncbi:hypothetical protein AHF37_09916 [Paragonimus kellicotti]|nr:hypothetical protein AHF37_09916 [Paragonimus kellicotti]